MFGLVDRVDDYPAFLPWCGGASARELDPGGPHGGPPRIVEASIAIAYHGVRSRFTTRNECRHPASIDMALVEGPFRSLKGHWRFDALRADACKVTLLLEYEFAAGLLARLVAPVFDMVANSFIDSFAKRADELYGGSQRG